MNAPWRFGPLLRPAGQGPLDVTGCEILYERRDGRLTSILRSYLAHAFLVHVIEQAAHKAADQIGF